MLTAADYRTFANCREIEFHPLPTINGSTRLEQIFETGSDSMDGEGEVDESVSDQRSSCYVWGK